MPKSKSKKLLDAEQKKRQKKQKKGKHKKK